MSCEVSPGMVAAMVTLARPEVLVVGAGGHAKVCVEALSDSGFSVIGCLSADGLAVAGLPCAVLGLDADLATVAADLSVANVFVAIGDNRSRAAACHLATKAGLTLVNAVSRFAMVSPGAAVGVGVAVFAGAVVNTSAVVGDGVILNTRSSVDHDSQIGAFAHIAVGVSLAGGVAIGERTLIGIGASVAPGRRIGAHAVVGAGAVVVHDVADGVTVVGVPARPLVR